MPSDDPFSNWSSLISMQVFSSDDKKLGFLRAVLSDYMVIGSGLINITKYFIPKTLAESVSKKGIRLRITAYEARSKYSYKKVKNMVDSFEYLPKSAVEKRAFYDRLETVKSNTTRNRIAAVIAFISAILFLISGYKANLAIYHIAREEILIYTLRDFWAYAVLPIGILALISQLGGIAVLVGAALFAANRVNLGKFLVVIGTGQGLLTVGLRLLSELWAGKIDNNYITWLTTSATGLGIVFAIIAQSISKGQKESITSKMLRFILRR